MALPTQRSRPQTNYLRRTYLIYGEPKVGKTTTAAAMGDDEQNKLLFFTTEPGHNFQNIYKYKLTDAKGMEFLPFRWEHFIKFVQEFCNEQHSFAAIVIDVTDDLFKWCSHYVCNKKGIEHASDEGFGKGYDAVQAEFEKPFKMISQKGYGIIFISHAKTKEKELGARKLTVTDCSMSNTARKVVNKMCDYILYCYTDANGKRLIRTKGNDLITAGDRSNRLPEIMELDAKKLIELLSADSLTDEGRAHG